MMSGLTSERRCFRWALVISGSSRDLEDAGGFFAQADPAIHVITPEGSTPVTVLTSPQMDALDDRRQVHDVAQRLLALVNGALFIADPAREPLKWSELRKRNDDGTCDEHIFVEPAMFRDRDKFYPPTVTGGIQLRRSHPRSNGSLRRNQIRSLLTCSSI